MPIIDLIRIRRATAAEWTAKNPLLRLGEPGFETDTLKIKIGNGVGLWNALDYVTGTGGGGGATNLHALTDVTLSSPSSGQVLKYDGSQWVNAVDATGGGGGGSSTSGIDGGTATSNYTSTTPIDGGTA